MRTIYPVALVIAMGLVGLMMGMSGFNAAFGVGEQPTTVGDRVEAEAQNGSVGEDSEGLKGSTGASSGSGSLVGMIVGGAFALYDVLALLVLLPWKLESLGFPHWFAYPTGIGIQLLGSITGLQFAANRVIR